MRWLPMASSSQLAALAQSLDGRATTTTGDAAVDAFLRAHGPGATVAALRILEVEREAAERANDERVELVWTGPEGEAAGTRETAVVARELFRQATQSVTVAGYAFAYARELLAPLAERMDQLPSLDVRLFMNVSRRDGDTRPEASIVADAARRFWEHEWSGRRRPALFYFPAALASAADQRAVLHAKCIVVDRRRLLVTSANLTEAAYDRNIELGVILNDARIAAAVAAQFDVLAVRGVLRSF